MTQRQLRWHQPLQFLLIGGILCVSSHSAIIQGTGVANAQLRPIADTTLGNEQSVVAPFNPAIDVINGGARRGANLFHSFREFNVGDGRGVYFTNPAGVTNILSRVTGGNPSQILGTLGVLGTANLFLINPRGILFGANAQLDVGGSFIASTANSLVFNNGFAFSATDLQAPPLLTVNVPIGLQYGSNPEAIQVQGSFLQVPDGQTLTLAGGAVNIDGAGLGALGGRVELAGVADVGVVGLTQQGQEWRLSVPDGLARADVAIANDAIVNVRAGGGGSVAITARNLTIAGAGIRLRAGIEAGLGAVGAQAGDIDLNATQTMNIDASVVANAVLPGSTGNGGALNISAGDLRLANGAIVNTFTLGQGNAGNITITARDTVSVDGVGINGVSRVLSRGEFGLLGQGGDITITTGRLSLTNGAQVATPTFGQGNAGKITITASDTVSLDKASVVVGSVLSGATGQGGDIRITTSKLLLSDGSAVNTSTLGSGNAGNIAIIANDTVSIDGVSSDGFSSAVASRVEDAGASGRGGDIHITTASLLLTNGGTVDASTFGQGDAGSITITAGVLSATNGGNVTTSLFGQGTAGNITITARDWVSFDGAGSNGDSSGAFSAIGSRGIGQGGDISITTDQFSLTNGGTVDASTFGRGDAGNITIVAREAASVDGVGSNGFPSGVFSAVKPDAIGQGGDININTSVLSVTNGGYVDATTLGRGDAGNISITAREAVSFDGVGSNGSSSGAYSTVFFEALGQGGNISITTGKFFLTDGALLVASTLGQGSSGDITITASDAVFVDGEGSNGSRSAAFSTVGARAIGQGGDISITTGTLSLTNGGLVSATTAGQGNAGDIIITAKDAVAFDGADSDGFPSGAFSRVTSKANGQGGDIRITTGALSLTNGGQVDASTRGQGNAGDTTITARDAVSFDGESSNGFASGAFSAVEFGAVGQGGNITVQTELFSIANKAILSASSDGQGGAGNLDVTARQLRLDNQGSIQAQTASGQGGNITLNVRDVLLLRRNSLISATAGTAQAGGDGGNITFNGNFIVAVPNENSDISANAFTGSGGRVNINAQGLFGIQFRPQLTPLSDITASSAFGVAGVVAINTPDVDPNRGLVQLPVDLTDASRLIVQTCPTGDGIAKQPNEFIITGRGGLPPTPSEAVNRDAIQVDLVTADVGDRPAVSQREPDQNPVRLSAHVEALPPSPNATLVEAQGLQVAADGSVFLVAAAPQNPISPSLNRLIHCR